jgi:hypothetical protein
MSAGSIDAYAERSACAVLTGAFSCEHIVRIGEVTLYDRYSEIKSVIKCSPKAVN